MKKESGIVIGKSHLVLIGLLIVASFLIGTLYTKVQYLEKNGSPTAGAQKPVSKYKSFDDAMADMAKIAKMDSKKLVSCMNGGTKAQAVASDVAEGNTAGVNGTPAFLINGKLLGGAFPLESFKEVIDKELAGTGSTNVTDYSQSLQDAAKQGAFDPKPRTVTVGNAQTKGSKNATVTIVEFSDFQCPYCERAYPVINAVLKTYGDKVLLAYKHFPLVTIHPHAQKTAEAAVCAAEQGKFWEFHNALFEHQSDWSSI